MRSETRQTQNVNELPRLPVIAAAYPANTSIVPTFFMQEGLHMSKKGKHNGKKGNHKTSGSANGKNGYH